MTKGSDHKSMPASFVVTLILAFSHLISGLKIGSQSSADFYHSAEELKTLFREIGTENPSKAR